MRLPQRAADAESGSAFGRRAQRMSPVQREKAIVDEVLAGNIPEFQRKLVPVELSADSRRGKVWVMPDYLAIGNDGDFLRVPMTMRSAKEIARAMGCVLPTSRLVDVIQSKADVVVTSPTMTGDHMSTTLAYIRHNAAIEEHRREAGGQLGQLLSGPKKDLVLTSRALSSPGRTAIYGWFDRSGTPIQPVSVTHDENYVDYAHGVRLVDETMEVGGKSVKVLDALADRESASLISDEGHYDLRVGWERGW